LCVERNSSLRPAVARGTAQVVGRARGGARCASRVLDRGAQADARGAARCFSQVLDRCAQVIAAAPLRCRNRRRTTLLMCSGKYSIYPVAALNYPGAPRPMPAVPLFVFRRHLIVVLRSLPRRRDAIATGEDKIC
jgi:hypothetical protein